MTAATTPRPQFEARLASLRGRRLVGVRYIEIRYEAGQPAWDYSPAFDTLDYGVDLLTDDGQTLGITWGAEFIQYGLSLRHGSVRETVTDGATWDVSTHSRWSTVLGQRITATTVYWAEDDPLARSPRIYPQDLELRFESGERVFVCALQFLPESQQFFGMADQVTVFFGEDEARRARVGPFASDPNSLGEVAK